MTYRDFFQRLTGFTPSPFQERVAAALLAEKNVILRAPTGSGKTWAVLAPFLYAASRGEPIGDRLLYALPLRSLATSLYEDHSQCIAHCSATEHLAKGVRIQTGERREDELLEGPVTFCTIDQLLSSYLLHPVGLPSRCGNINAGAMLGALICFDEFHLLEPHKSMATAIEMLDTVAVSQPLSRFVLMTATLSTDTLAWLRCKLNGELIEVSPEEVRALPSQQGKTRYYRWMNRPLSARDVVQAHGGRRSIVIANTVTRAQQLFEELRSADSRAQLGEQTQIRLLHSRFLTRDRQRIESGLEAWFGPHATASDVILVSTQVVEAGLDYSCDNLHTEVAPMNAVVQRAGRCARRRGETGVVWCYALRQNSSGMPAYGPYQDLATVVDETAAALENELAGAPRAWEAHDELRLVDRVHTRWELAQLQPLDSLNNLRRKVREAMNGDNAAAVRDLVRDVSSINVVITDQPETLRFDRTQWPETLSVPPTSLWRLFDVEHQGAANWIVRSAREQEAFQGGALRMEWPTVESANGLRSAGWLVAIHPACATYDAEVGLVVGRGGPAPEVRYRERPKIERYAYRREDYSEHIRRVCAAGARRDPDNRVTTRRLSQLFGVSEAELSRWVDLVYRLHDVGKLSIDWQDAIWQWQSTKSGPPPAPRPPLAHSDYDPAVDGSARAARRPPHAAEGAYAALSILSAEMRLEDDNSPTLAAVTAIARHHGAFTKDLSDFRLLPDADLHVASTLGRGARTCSLLSTPNRTTCATFAEDCLLVAAEPDAARALLLYLYFVRRLRIADQNSFAEE